MMKNGILFSVVAIVDDFETVYDFLNTLSTKEYNKYTQLIFVTDDVSQAKAGLSQAEAVSNTHKKHAVFDFHSCIFVENDLSSLAQAYNEGLARAEGKWVHFTFSSAYYSQDAFSQVLYALETKNYNFENDSNASNTTAEQLPETIHIGGITPFVLNKAGQKKSKYKMRCRVNGVVNLDKDYDSLNLSLYSLVIHTALAKEIGFEESCPYDCDHLFLLRLYSKERFIFNHPSSRIYLPRKTESALETYPYAHFKEWYLNSAKAFCDFLQETKANYGEIPIILQIAVYYLINNKFGTNYFERNTGTLTREEAFEFDDLCSGIFKNLSDKVIFSNYNASFVAPPQIQLHACKSKYGCLGDWGNEKLPYHPEAYENHLFYVPNGKCMDDFALTADEDGVLNYNDYDSLIYLKDFEDENMTVQVINCISDNLEFDTRYSDEYFKGFDYNLIAVIADSAYDNTLLVSNDYEKIPLTDTGIFSSYKCFGITLTAFRRLYLSVPAQRLQNKKLVFALEYRGKRYALNVRYIRAYSRLSGSKFNYWMYSEGKIARPENRAIRFEECSSAKHFLLETAFLANLFFTDRKMKFTRKLYCIFLRLLADIVHPVYRKKNIWLTFDKLYKAGDNGEYIFDYCSKNSKDGIHCYYIIDRESLDCKRLKKKYGKMILVHQTLRQRLMALNAQAVLTTHATAMRYCGINNYMLPYVKDKLKAPVICIQHGLTIQKIAQYQNRVFDNIRLYTLASKYEWKNICNPVYGFTEKQLRMTGLPRYDGLKSNDKKQILITPTWRRNVVNSGIAFRKKTHNDDFKSTAYYRIYNSLINDEKLIDCAKKNGYRLIYLLHPAMSAQAEDYERNDYVELIQATGDMNYEKILTESSLMLTDYSGVQFDFAYQRKALVYYHPNELPPHYDPGKIDYETMGFGPICRTHREIVDCLCEYMNNGCKNPEEYVRRADDFFAFSDHNNCERVYNYVLEFLKEEMKSNNNNIRN